MEHATGVLGGLSLWGIIVPVVVVVAIIGGAIVWAVLAARKGIKGMNSLDRRLDHGEKKIEKKSKESTAVRRR